MNEDRKKGSQVWLKGVPKYLKIAGADLLFGAVHFVLFCNVNKRAWRRLSGVGQELRWKICEVVSAKSLLIVYQK